MLSKDALKEAFGKREKLKNLFPSRMRPKLMAIPGGPRVHSPTDMLGPDHFKIAIGIAVAVHLVLLGAWSLMPKPKVVEVPVQSISLKLGGDVQDAVSAEELSAIAPGGENHDEVESTLAKLVRDPSVDAARADSVAGVMEKAMGKKDDEIIKQYVRPAAVQAKDSATTAEQKDIVMRYTNLVGMWIQKFKVVPPEAKSAGMAGNTMLHLQIDRQGNIRNFVLEGSTGHAELDRATIDMVRRANPVPAVPNDYPAGELFEFSVPVQFSAQ